MHILQVVLKCPRFEFPGSSIAGEQAHPLRGPDALPRSPIGSVLRTGLRPRYRPPCGFQGPAQALAPTALRSSPQGQHPAAPGAKRRCLHRAARGDGACGAAPRDARCACSSGSVRCPLSPPETSPLFVNGSPPRQRLRAPLRWSGPPILTRSFASLRLRLPVDSPNLPPLWRGGLLFVHRDEVSGGDNTK